MISPELELPRAINAVYKVIEQGRVTHPNTEKPWPPVKCGDDNLDRMRGHLSEYMDHGRVMDEHGMSMLAKVVCRGMFELERLALVAGEKQEVILGKAGDCSTVAGPSRSAHRSSCGAGDIPVQSSVETRLSPAHRGCARPVGNQPMDNEQLHGATRGESDRRPVVCRCSLQHAVQNQPPREDSMVIGEPRPEIGVVHRVPSKLEGNM